MKKLIAMIGLLTVLLAGCGKNDIAKVYEKSESDGIVATYYEMNDGTWQCDDNIYQFRLELAGRMPNAKSGSSYVVLTDNENLTFEDVAKSLYSSSLEVSKIMDGSMIVEMK